MKIVTLLTARKSLPLDAENIDTQLKYKIVKFLKNTESDEEFYRTEFAKIVSICAEKDDNDEVKTDDKGNISMRRDMQKEFIKRSEDLNNTEVDTHNFSLNMDEVSQLKLSIRQMLDLDDFIQE